MKLSIYRNLLIRLMAVSVTSSLFFADDLLALECLKKTDRIGLLEVSQVPDAGRCVIIVSQNDPGLLAKNNATTFKNTRDFEKRRYTFTSDGLLELYDGGSAQEIQFTQAKNPLSYSVGNGEIVVRLPSGQRINFSASPKGQKGIVKSFTGFVAASESAEGFKLTPAGSDTVLVSEVTTGSFPHDKKNSNFTLVGANGVVATYKTSAIFQSGSASYPLIRPDFVSNISKQKPEKTSSSPSLPPPVPTETKTIPQVATVALKLEPMAREASNGKREVSTKNKSTTAVIASECSNSQVLIEKLNQEYLKIQGELTLSKLAFYYLKDSAGDTESLENKIKTLLTQKDLPKYQKIIEKKVKLNAGLISLKDHFLTTQKKWTETKNEKYLLADLDFKYISLVNEVEKKSASKNQIINFVRMIDSSYRLSANSAEDKLLGLEKRVVVLNQKIDANLDKIKSLKALCHLEAQATCLNCLVTGKDDNLSTLKDVSDHQSLSESIQWGSFWLHTGKKTKAPAGN